jgi:membrane-associated phospholipid phosphatase
MAGVHWPSDVLAGQRLGQIFAAYWLGLPENAQMIQDASAEWNNPKKAKGPGAVDARASLQVDRFR